MLTELVKVDKEGFPLFEQKVLTWTFAKPFFWSLMVVLQVCNSTSSSSWDPNGRV